MTVNMAACTQCSMILSSSDVRWYQKSHKTVFLSRLELDGIDIGNQLPFLSSSGMLLVMHCDYR